MLLTQYEADIYTSIMGLIMADSLLKKYFSVGEFQVAKIQQHSHQDNNDVESDIVRKKVFS